MISNKKINLRRFRTSAINNSEPVSLEQTAILPKRAVNFRRILYWSIVALAIAFIVSLQPVFASNIWDTFSNFMRDIYGRLLSVSTIIAITAATVALLVRMISRNQRAVDE